MVVMRAGAARHPPVPAAPPLTLLPGRYNVREETFITETEAAATEYKDPVSGKPLEKMLESSYFFKQSKCVSQSPEALHAALSTPSQVSRPADRAHQKQPGVHQARALPQRDPCALAA